MPHIHEKIDFTADVFVVHKNKVLLRLHDKYKVWLAVGGHIELNEDPNQAAIREVKEEVGLDVKLVATDTPQELDTEDYKQLISPKYLNRHDVVPGHEHISFVYFATSDTDQVIPEKPDDEWKWLTREEIENMDLRPNIKFYALKALEELGEK